MTGAGARYLLLGVVIAVAGCGGDDDPSQTGAGKPPPREPAKVPTVTAEEEAPGSGQTVLLEASPTGQLSFDWRAIEAAPGELTLVLQNPSPVPHGIGIRGNGIDRAGSVVEKGQESKVVADVKPGAYEFYCPVPGHEPGGMQGKLVVR